jgi:hypothetical protein
VMSTHGGTVWDFAASEGTRGAGTHPLVVSCGSDGVCNLISTTNRIFFGSKVIPPEGYF